jgi:AraC family transcriptional regulator of adaptative response/methylated-DNA-[protein]-cysteine methyltransferase
MIQTKLPNQPHADNDMTMSPHIDSSFGEICRRVDGTAALRVTGSSYGARGAGALMHYTIIPTPDFQMLLAATQHGVSWLGIHPSSVHLEAGLRADYPLAEIVRADTAMAKLASRVIADLADQSSAFRLPMDIRATSFQLEVWCELCAIPRGATRSYGEIARRIGRPAASRAVGHANGANPTAIVIPCHRAIGTDGSLTGYRWGIEIKQRLLEREALGNLCASPLVSS